MVDVPLHAIHVTGYYNPTSLTTMDFWGQGSEATIGFLRQAEIKHGRVAMAAFIGFITGSNGIVFPWAQSLEGTSFADIAAAGGPAAQLDALPTTAKLQMLVFIGFLEWFGENKYALEQSGEKHYMRGGKPGVYPKFNGVIPHPVCSLCQTENPDGKACLYWGLCVCVPYRAHRSALSLACVPQMPLELFDPLGLSKNRSEEAKQKGLLAEINNGRLAQLGIMAFVAESKIPGSVPALSGLIKPYSGEPMAFFSASDNLPFVTDMLNFHI